MPYPTTARGLIFEFNMAEARLELVARRVYLNVHSVTGNVVDTE